MIRFACQLARADFMLEARFAAQGGITALFGPSGAGKSTIIRLLAGLERPDSGLIKLGGTVLLDTARRVDIRPHRRRMGLVFQDALLFPHFSVRANLTYGRFFAPRGERRIGFDAVVAVLGISHLLKRAPVTLSGGERQRVAIGRALLASPRLLLMDEPLAALDAARKNEILPFIENLRDEFDIPILYVSHNRDEVMRLARRVVRLDGGRVIAEGKPAEILPAPETARPDEPVSILTTIVRETLRDYDIAILDHPAGTLLMPGLRGAEPGQRMRIAIAASQVTIANGTNEYGTISPAGARGRPRQSLLRGRVTGIETGAGPFVLVAVELTGGDRLSARITRLARDELGLAPGREIDALIHALVPDKSV